jgi:hypothetical protein
MSSLNGGGESNFANISGDYLTNGDNQFTGYYGLFYNNATYTISGANNTDVCVLSNTLFANGFTLVGNDVSVTNTGNYELNYAVQLGQTTASTIFQLHLVVNGTELANSSVQLQFAGAVSKSPLTGSIIATLNSGDSVGMRWYSSQAGGQIITAVGSIPATMTIRLEINAVDNQGSSPNLSNYYTKTQTDSLLTDYGSLTAINIWEGDQTFNGAVVFPNAPPQAFFPPSVADDLVNLSYLQTNMAYTTASNTFSSGTTHNFTAAILTAATQVSGNNSTRVATTAFVKSLNYVQLSATNVWTGLNSYTIALPTSTLTPTLSTEFVTKVYADTKGALGSSNAWTGNTNTFNSFLPTSTIAPTTANQFCNKTYVDLKGTLAGVNAWTNTNTFNTVLPTSTLTPTLSTELITKGYADTTYIPSPSSVVTVNGSNIYGGLNSLSSITTGTDNISLGYNSSTLLDTGSLNVALGTQALQYGTSCTENFALGYGTLANAGLAGGSFNVALGAQSLQNQNGSTCIAIGRYTAKDENNGNDNIHIGYFASVGPKNCLGDVVIGAYAGNNLSSLVGLGNYNCFLGHSAGINVEQGNENVCIGRQAGMASGLGNYNHSVALGTDSVITSSNSIFLGTSSDMTYAMGGLTVPAPRMTNIATAPILGTQILTATPTATISLTGGREVFLNAAGIVAVILPTPTTANIGQTFNIIRNGITLGNSYVIGPALGTDRIVVDGVSQGNYQTAFSQASICVTCIGTSGDVWVLNNYTNVNGLVLSKYFYPLQYGGALPSNSNYGTIKGISMGNNCCTNVTASNFHTKTNVIIGSDTLSTTTTAHNKLTVVGSNCLNLSTAANIDGTTAIGYSAGSLYASYGQNNTLIGANTDLASSAGYASSFCIGQGSIITGNFVGVLGTSQTTVIVPSAQIQYGNNYKPHSVYQTITGALDWNTTPPTPYPKYILYSMAGVATTTLTLPLISNASIFEGMEFIFRRTNSTAGATTTSILSVSRSGTDVIYIAGAMTNAATAVVLASGQYYGKIVCVNKTSGTFAWAYFPS